MNHPAPHKVLKSRRDDNIRLAEEMMEDSAPRRSRPAKAALESIGRTSVSGNTRAKSLRRVEHTLHLLTLYFPAPEDLRLVKTLRDTHRPTGH